ncbi:MAG: hypothetical protein AAFW65_06810 [Pseudomonadota bacterium]
MKRLLLSAALPVLLTACASLEPEPCTAEWVQWKTDRVLTPFAQDNRGLINDLRDFSQDLEDPGPFTMLRMAVKLEEFQNLAGDFQTDIMPELEAAVDQCGSPAKFVPAFTNFLREQGVEEEMLVWVEAVGTLAIQQQES